MLVQLLALLSRPRRCPQRARANAHDRGRRVCPLGGLFVADSLSPGRASTRRRADFPEAFQRATSSRRHP